MTALPGSKAGFSCRRMAENRFFIQLLPVIFLGLLVAFFSAMTNGRFTSLTSLKIIFEQALIVGTVSTGAAFIFASGNVNLAMGATTVLTATLAGMVYNATGSVAVMIVFSLLAGVVLMVVSALLSSALHVRVIYVTIVMMTLLVAIQQSILGGSTVSLPYAMVNGLKNGGFSYIAFILYFALMIAVFHLTDVGRALRLIGTNSTCAEQTGHVQSKYLMVAFIIAGIGCGIGSLLVIVRAGSIGANTLSSLNMDCMLALVLGGMSIFGGSRSFAFAGMLGALTVCVLNQGLLMINVNSSIIQGVRGLLFLLLVSTTQKRPKGLPTPEG